MIIDSGKKDLLVRGLDNENEGDDYGLLDMKLGGDKFNFLHGQDIDPVLAEIKQNQKNQEWDGWTEDRSMRYVGTIPAIEWLRHPEWRDDPSLIIKFLQSPEGQKYQANKIDTGRSGHVIIK